jgi:predicted O-linked N-acetylglucosamine transferase (SPINDLY family)
MTQPDEPSAAAHDNLPVGLINQGYQRRQQGDLQGAIAMYRQAAALPQAPAAAHFNLGNALLDSGDAPAAQLALRQALALDPAMSAAAMQLARCAVQLGEPQHARAQFNALLLKEPENFSAWLELGHVCRQQGDRDAMLDAYRRATASAPQRWEGHLALARALEETGQHDLGAVAYHRAVLAAGAQSAPATQQQPAPGRTRDAVLEVHWRTAKFRLELGDAGRALEAMRQALMASRLAHRGEPADVDLQAAMQIDLGEILIRLGMTELAHRAFERASAATTEATLVRLAETSFRFNLWQEAQAVLRRNVELHPQSAVAHWNLAHSYAESWQLEDAMAELAAAEAIAPQLGAKSMRASVAGRIGDVDTAMRLYTELAEDEGPRSKMRSSAAMSSLYSDQLDAQQVADLHRRLFAPLGEGARPASSFGNDRDPDRRLKVGIVTADFHHQHPVNIFMQPILYRLQTQAFELTVYFTGVTYDEQTRLARQRVANWVACSQWSDQRLAQQIERDGIDILLDLAGHTSLNRMSLFAQRAAPVQASYLGYPGSTGVPNIDWILADAVVAPPGSDSLFSERVMRLPHTVFCFHPEADYPLPEPAAHAERALTFGSFNNVPKLTPRTVRLWARVLLAVPGSRLLLKAPTFQDAGAVRVFTERFAAEGIAADRLVFRGPVGLTAMMAEYADVDIALDPVPYNGGTTTLQAMWMGVPVVVRAGHSFVSRMGASFMTAAGLPDWVAADDEAYVVIAQRMAADRQALRLLKKGLRQRLQASPAWDIERHAKAFEAGLRAMWQARCQPG